MTVNECAKCAPAPEPVTREYAREQAGSALRKAREILDDSAPHLEATVRVGLLVSIASEWRWLHSDTF